jgi:hypothetical protein
MRKEAIVTITRDGRDRGKVFTIREMPAAQATEWFDRAMQLIARSGIDVPPDIFEHGPAGFAVIGIGAAMSAVGRAPYSDVKPLLEELMNCVVSLRSPGTAVDITMPAAIMSQIEEVATILHLREEVLSLHLGFSLAARLSEFRTMAALMMGGNGLNTETSPEP